MPFSIKAFLQQYYKIVLCFAVSFCLIRCYEYHVIASKYFINHTYRFEMAGVLYDIWTCLIYSILFSIPAYLLYRIHKKLPVYFLHAINVLLIIVYLGLIVVFSERNTPFDHEFFTRNMGESILTTRQMMTSGFSLYIPFIIFIGLYFLLYYKLFRKVVVPHTWVMVLTGISILSLSFVKFSEPAEQWFDQPASYYMVCNKFNFWLQDTYQYFMNRDQFNASKLSKEALVKQIDFYQANQPFDFISKEYPLLHENTDKDVLGNFFHFNNTPPNIVILVVEGLSRDFSGEGAYASSFTPFLDSLSKHSLYWDNFLSTAPGTFAAHPAISGSLPYGKRGFSLMNVMPEHLSLIKILRQNGYWTNFMIGFNPDFDNMGGYIRLQGTDFVLSKYPSKYKEMGVGEEGWSMGYPDDALFSRSFEVMDSLRVKVPLLNIYHTATTHMPYLFEQKPLYEKLFDKKMKTVPVAPEIKKTLIECKKVLVTYMFADDCFRKFFADYAKRPDYKNTIFFITGDHHIGSFPSTSGIDDYHVPLIVYSPMLKEARKFHSVNSHNNLAPTITAMLMQNFNLPHKPEKVHWLGDVMDTATAFRNIHSMPFMEWSREISDYIYKDYYLSGTQLYKMKPGLMLEDCNDEAMKAHITALRDNFKIINSYVCDNNKLFPAQQPILPGEKKLLLDYADPAIKTIFDNDNDTSLMREFKIPMEYKFLYVEMAADVNLPSPEVDHHPSVRLGLVDRTNNGRNYLYWANRDVVMITKGDNYVPQQWNSISTNDMFTLSDYRKYKNMVFELAIYTDSIPINLKMKDLNVKIYGVK
ncbi:MAG: sulfatase-like hydrolase/transferase [Bacteroidota bacterium]|nr:sulfatase-like hydrolase/transferase [Bacteroidota bacterium]